MQHPLMSRKAAPSNDEQWRGQHSNAQPKEKERHYDAVKLPIWPDDKSENNGKADERLKE